MFCKYIDVLALNRTTSMLPSSATCSRRILLFRPELNFKSPIPVHFVPKMPFMKGVSPIRRTLKYLEAGNIILKPTVKILSINFNATGKFNEGAREFIFWNMPQIQYKNPDVQFLYLRNLTPSPFIRCFLDDGEEVLIDIDNKDRHEIHDFLKRILGKTEQTLADEAIEKTQVKNPANFGWDYKRHCICEVPGHVPCPSVIQYPKHMRGKYKYGRELPDE